MTTNILFLCPHSAAKSVAAAAFIGREAAKYNLAISTSTAGTEPEPDVLPIVRAHLESNELPVSEPPRNVGPDDFDDADLIINIGCDLSGHTITKPVEEWAIPNFSDNPKAAFEALEQHTAALVARMMAD